MTSDEALPCIKGPFLQINISLDHNRDHNTFSFIAASLFAS